jgi:hypothetical protein
MATAEAGRVVVRLEGKDVNLTQLLDKVEKQLDQGKQKIQQYDRQLAQLGPTTNRLESSKLSYARALALVAEKQGRAGESAHILATELGKVAPNSIAAQRALLQLQQTLDRQAASTTAAKNATGSMLTNFASGFNKLLGAYFAVSQVTQGIGSLIEAGNQLEKTQATFKALSVTPEEYARNLEVAKNQQKTFGGSLQENLDQMSGFIFTARNAGVSLQELTNLARKLAIIDPAQGFKGASIALKEFFSGDITSLARRFELPRDMLHGIDDLGSGAEKIAALNGQLEKMGITNELITAQANTIAVEYDKMWGALQDGVAGTGQVIAASLLPVLKKLGDSWKAVFGDSTNITQLTTIGTKTQALSTTFFNSATSLDAYNKKVQEYNAVVDKNVQTTNTWLAVLNPAYAAFDALGVIITDYKLSLDELTPAQYAYAQSLLRMGVEGATVIQTVTELGNTINTFANLAESSGALWGESAETIAVYKENLVALAASSEQGSIMAYEYNAAVQNGTTTMEAATTVIKDRIADERRLESAQLLTKSTTEGTTAATNDLTNALSINTSELANNAATAAAAQVQSEYLKFVQEQLYSTALAASDGLMTAGQAAAQMKAEFGIAEEQTYGLINALIQLNRHRAIAAIGSQGSPDRLDRALQGRSYTDIIKQSDAIKRANKAEQDYLRTKGSTTEQLARARAELDKTTRDTEEYWKALKRVEDLEEKAASEAKRGKGGKSGAAPKLTANEKLNNQLLAQQDKVNDKLEDAEEKHMQNLVKIYEDYNKRIVEQQKRNELSKRRSKVGFYEDNAELPPGLDPAVYAAQYEQAFLEAQKIAQEGSAQLANEYLEMRQKQIEELRKLDEEAAGIQANEELTDEQKRAALEYLEGRRKLVADAQAEELKQLLEGGDEINRELAERLAEEDRMYAEQTDKIVENSDRAAEAKIKNAERSKISVDAENKALAEQAARLDEIARKQANIGYKPTTPQAPVTPPIAGQPQSTPDSNSIIIAPDTVLMVKQLEMWLVFDQAVVNSIGDMTARLEAKIDNVSLAISEAKTSITGAVNNVERAVGRIKGRVVE